MNIFDLMMKYFNIAVPNVGQHVSIACIGVETNYIY